MSAYADESLISRAMCGRSVRAIRAAGFVRFGAHKRAGDFVEVLAPMCVGLRTIVYLWQGGDMFRRYGDSRDTRLLWARKIRLFIAFRLCRGTAFHR